MNPWRAKHLLRIGCCLALVWLATSPPRELAAQTPGGGVSPRVQVMLIRNALAALNHANITGNYAVLRDLGSEDLRRRLTAADLAQIFAEHRARHFDLSPALAVEPQLAEPPNELPGGRLRLVGAFPTQPEAIGFVVTYQRSRQGMALDDIAVTMHRAEASLRPAPAAH